MADSKKNPAVMQLVLDGRQRLTTLALAFGGLRSPDDRFLFSGRWFVDIDKFPKSDDFIVYKKRREVEKLQLNSNATCLRHALIPLDQYKDLSYFNQHINDADIYPSGAFPDKAIRERRAESLKEMYETFLAFQLPVAELPDSISLAEVCDIFDVLNTTGTKVSTFDLIHNLCFADSTGEFDLRAEFDSYRDEQSHFGLFCDPARPEYFCQAVTACYLLDDNPEARSSISERKVMVQTIKGGDLVETPYSFYARFDQNIGKVDTFCDELFASVLMGTFRSREIPYPVSILPYIALRWKGERLKTTERPRPEHLNRFIRAFFWRNALTSRYDQGFLTLFASDLRDIDQLLLAGAKLDEKDWKEFAQKGLDEIFTQQFSALTEDRLVELLLSGETRGALKQALSLFLFAKVHEDIVSGESLDRFTNERDSTVQLHHIYPSKWCRDNKAHHGILSEDEIINAVANLVPLSAKANNVWRSKSPATAIKSFKIEYEHAKSRLTPAFIDKDMFDILVRPDPNPEDFWKRRARLMAKELAGYQHI